ncbi:MAG: hypothetical protein RL518_2402 [Pseudomonadota bacterium]
MVGAKEDLPLTSRGIEQAQSIGTAIASSQTIPNRIMSGPLQRTKVFAESVRALTNPSATVEIDDRLIEFDYGAWSGLSNEEIEALSGREALEAWQERSERPSGVTFIPSAQKARADAEAVLQELATLSGCCLVVSSNGRLREFGQLLSRAPSSSAFKVRTGHACLVVRDGGTWRVLGWDLDPTQLKDALDGLA